MLLFHKKKAAREAFDPARFTPVIRSSICTGEKAAGFRENGTDRFHEVMLLRTPADLEKFRKDYDIRGEIETMY